MQSSNEAAMKKKLQKFLWELANFGTVRGFKHFSCYLRGKEELLVTVKNKIQGSTASIISNTLPISPAKKPLCATDSFNSYNLPYDKSSIVFSLQNQLLLRGKEDKEADLLPASPSEEETQTETDVTLFLIAGYARYSCPYVWVRSNHQRIFTVCGDKDSDKDSPLKLKSTSRWKDEDVKIFDIVAEIVKLCTYPAPRNPFELDLDYFRFLKQPDQLLASAAMTCLLQTIIIHSPESKVYAAKVSDELQLVSKIHFQSLRDLTRDGKLGVSQKEVQEARHKGHQQTINPSQSQWQGVTTPVTSSSAYFKQPIPNAEVSENLSKAAYYDNQSKTPSCQPSTIAQPPPPLVPSHTQAVLPAPQQYPLENSSQHHTLRAYTAPPLRPHAPATPHGWPQNQLAPRTTPPSQLYPAGPVSLMTPSSLPGAGSFHTSSAPPLQPHTPATSHGWPQNQPAPRMTPPSQLYPAGPVSLMTPSSLPSAGSAHTFSASPDSFQVQNSAPSNVSGITYGRGARGAFPGGYDRMPAPSML